MAALSLQNISAGNNSISYTAADAGGETIQFVPALFLGVKNGDVSAKQVTITAVKTSVDTGVAGALTVSDIVVSVPAGEERMIGIPAAYASAGVVAVSYDAVTSVTVAAQYVKI